MARGVDDLPEYRRLVFLAFHRDPGYLRIHDVAFDPQYRIRCEPLSKLRGEPPRQLCRARLASDGLYHLLGPGGCQAKSRTAQPNSGDMWRHRTFYVTNSRTGLTVNKAGLRRWCGPEIDAAMTPRNRRCNRESPLWPGSLVAKKGRRLTIRQTLVDTYGLMCQACGVWPATDIDHDHDTGRVRGYLCRDCNHQIEMCVHLSGCPYAEYLNDPPGFRIPDLPLYGRPTPVQSFESPVCSVCWGLTIETVWVETEDVSVVLPVSVARTSIGAHDARIQIRNQKTTYILVSGIDDSPYYVAAIRTDPDGYFPRLYRWVPTGDMWVRDSVILNAYECSQRWDMQFWYVTEDEALKAMTDIPPMNDKQDMDILDDSRHTSNSITAELLSCSP